MPADALKLRGRPIVDSAPLSGLRADSARNNDVRRRCQPFSFWPQRNHPHYAMSQVANIFSRFASTCLARRAYLRG